MTGVLALQGDFEAHLRALRSLGEDASEVRTPEDLQPCDRLIMPGGESTTLGILLQLSGLDSAIPSRVSAGMPVWGTCMGMILLAKEIVGSAQFRFGLMDITVERNAFGSQVFSFEQGLEMKGIDEPIQAVFIRAPVITGLGEGVERIASVDGKVVAAKQGRMLGTSFHPELTGDPRVHAMFLAM